MILSDVASYFSRNGRACMADLTVRFEMEPPAIRGMLDLLVAKGRIRRIGQNGACGGCAKCDPERLEVYEWTGPAESA